MSFLRLAARNASCVRAFSSTTVARKDLVQDIYLREIKAYKPATPVSKFHYQKARRETDISFQAKDAHVGVVKSYTLPPTPKAPALPSDLASALAEYDAAEPSVKAAAQVASETADNGASGAEAYLAFLEADLPKEEAHH
ncbi:hypothetical protein C0991_005147 [Blastosporella zonata]|nr:hypothetical protein C0991_005147 [Blastosporella zonata]